MKTPSYVMLSSDYSAQEPRITAFVSGEERMSDAFKHDRDVYATIASVAFGVPYENCLEFHPVTHEYQPDGKARRTEAKSILLGVTYGRSVPSIAEQLYGGNKGMTTEEKVKKAQKVYDAVMKNFPKIRNAMINAQNQAKTKGYVETILGRRRHLRDMQLPEFEFKAEPGYVNPDVDPLDINTLKDKSEIPDRIVKQLTEEFKQYKYFGQIVRRTKELHEKHIRVINNRPKINDASRQTLNCVDLDTEILTTDGWKHYNEVKVGDQILSYSTKLERVEFDKILDIHTYLHDTEVIKFKSPSFEAVSTPDHKWVCQPSDSSRSRFITSEHIERNKWSDYPILRVSNNDFKPNHLNDYQLNLLGWLMTDGSYTKPDQWYSMYIFQSTKRGKGNSIYLEMLRTLEYLNLDYNDRPSKKDETYHEIYLNKCEFTEWIRHTFTDRTLTFEFVSTLSQHQAKVLMFSMIQGDGWSSRGQIGFICGTGSKRDVFQYLCFVAGYASNSYVEDTIGVPYYIVSVLRIRRAHIHPQHKSREVVHGVWCVTTGNHTWIARKNGNVYITGNSIIQGSAADQTKMAMLRLENDPDWKRIGGRLLIPVHDELLAEVPMVYWKEGGEILSRCMVEAASFLPFPSKCDVEYSLRWYGLSYPCPYKKPDFLDINDLSSQDTESIKWLQYMLYECEYELPKHKEELGDNFRGDAAKGVDGLYDPKLKEYIEDYIDAFQLNSGDSFVDHIENYVMSGTIE